MRRRAEGETMEERTRPYRKYIEPLKKYNLVRIIACFIGMAAAVLMLFLPNFTCSPAEAEYLFATPSKLTDPELLAELLTGEDVRVRFSFFDDLCEFISPAEEVELEENARVERAFVGFMTVVAAACLVWAVLSQGLAACRSFASIFSADEHALEVYDSFRRRYRPRFMFTPPQVALGIAFGDGLIMCIGCFLVGRLSRQPVVTMYFFAVTGLSGWSILSLSVTAAAFVAFAICGRMKRRIKMEILREETASGRSEDPFDGLAPRAVPPDGAGEGSDSE